PLHHALSNSALRRPTTTSPPFLRRPTHPFPSFFFILTTRPPTSTLFPYTTLFRSFASSTVAQTRFASDVIMEVYELTRTSRPTSDRKSTRLNSSHVSISYAVFCLKKKKSSSYTSCLSVHTRLCSRAHCHPCIVTQR